MELSLSLYELNHLIKGVINNTFNQLYWIRTEISDVRVAQNGHCYLEFIEKDENNKKMIAKAKGNIWSNVFKLLQSYFESETGQTFASGLKVLVQVSIEFHELYGYSLNVHNIDPSYTLGDQAKNRALIVKQLKEEGVFDLNKDLQLPTIINRIAIISSPTAAGYEDFCNQLKNNSSRFVFYTHLFVATMQGEKTETSIVEALDRIYDNIDKFDVVVIIRGGGSTSELSSFDSYTLATNCAQFPIPIITGIGHERDDTVLDLVANTRVKTPTAAAEFIIQRAENNANYLYNIQDQLVLKTNQILLLESSRINTINTKVSYIIKDRTKDRINYLNRYADQLKNAVNTNLTNKRHQLNNIEQHINLASPENILKKGYSLTLKDSKIIKNTNELTKGDTITTILADGKVRSTIKE